MIFLKFLKESFLFALNALIANKLRTFLSLLGITVGIFAIISVFTVIGSLESNIRKSIESLGENVVYIQKYPWTLDMSLAWWDIIKRPVPKIQEVDEIKRRSQKASVVAFSIQTNKTVKYRNNSAERTFIWANSHDFEKIQSFELEKGRYFSLLESATGRNSALMGSDLAKDLFENWDPIGKEIKIMGRKVIVIGVLEKQGTSNFDEGLDNVVLIPINFARNIINIRNDQLNPMITVKAKENITDDELIDELKGIMRSIRRLKPTEKDDFSINRASFITQMLAPIFAMINLTGAIIGGFSILVGGFGIANIMFVSVKERTNIIGIQKALGAKNYFILLQFLYESVLLALTGGIVGLILVFIGAVFISYISEFNISLTLGNIISGLLISAIIGIISGFAPAYSASKLNPVEAINVSF